MTQRSREPLSVAILAGGRSVRMGGEDKAFLLWREEPFVTRISCEMLRISDDVLVLIGKKERNRFVESVPECVRVANDHYDFGTPVSGMLTACEMAKNDSIAFVACDMPLLHSEIISKLHENALGHSAAVPRWEDGRIEPLCSVCSVEQFRTASARGAKDSLMACQRVFGYLSDVVFTPVSELRIIDPGLESLTNINSRENLQDSLGSLHS